MRVKGLKDPTRGLPLVRKPPNAPRGHAPSVIRITGGQANRPLLLTAKRIADTTHDKSIREFSQGGKREWNAIGARWRSHVAIMTGESRWNR